MPSNRADAGDRLYFLDWVRIIAFFVLIAYHVGMYYVSWDWHVKSANTSSALEPFMLLSSPWRLGLLFLVSGVASGFMLTRLSALSFMGQRSVRLLVPLLFGMFVIVPPQAYYEVVEKVAYTGGYMDFMRLYLSGYPGFCRADDCLVMPTWNHLWFVAYLLVYTLVLGLIAMALGPRFDALARRVAGLLTGWKLVLLPLAVLGLAKVLLQSRFPTTHALVDDWNNHAYSFTLFLLGALLSRERSIWRRMDDMRWSALGIALTCWAMLVICFALPETPAMRPLLDAWWNGQRLVYTLCGWCAIIAACGFAHHHLQFDSPKRRYLTQAVFPVYILHQSLIVVIAHGIKPAKLTPMTEGLVLAVLTLFISLGVFELARRCRPLHLLLGIGKNGGAPEMRRQAQAGGAMEAA